MAPGALKLQVFVDPVIVDDEDKYCASSPSFDRSWSVVADTAQGAVDSFRKEVSSRLLEIFKKGGLKDFLLSRNLSTEAGFAPSEKTLADVHETENFESKIFLSKTISGSEFLALRDSIDSAPGWFRRAAKWLSKTEPDCLVWTGAVSKGGQPKVGVKGKVVTARRLSLELRYGPLPRKISVLNGCGNLRCVNPDHQYLSPGTFRIRWPGRKRKVGKGSPVTKPVGAPPPPRPTPPPPPPPSPSPPPVAYASSKDKKKEDEDSSV